MEIYRVPVFSRWLASSQNFLIMRKFGAANTRVILSLRDRVAELEEQLAEIVAIVREGAQGD